MQLHRELVLVTREVKLTTSNLRNYESQINDHQSAKPNFPTPNLRTVKMSLSQMAIAKTFTVSEIEADLQ